MVSKVDIDSVINQLINSQGNSGKKVPIKEKDVSTICKMAREIFMEQPVFLELEAPIKICGRSRPLLKAHLFRRCAWSVY